MTDEDFKQHIIAALARLETSMHDIVGNGQPGRLQKLEANVTYIFIALGILGALVLGPSALALLK